MPTIYRKTAKGVAEIETRAHRLPPRMRSALILVDGKRDTADLRALITQQADETLRSLFDQGFIEVVGETLPESGPVPLDGALAAPAPPPAPAEPARPSVEFEAFRRLAVRLLNDELGPAAEQLSMRMEKSRSLAELQPLLQQAVNLVGNMRGRAAAQNFASRFPF
jgi:hypothetical protein